MILKGAGNQGTGSQAGANGQKGGFHQAAGGPKLGNHALKQKDFQPFAAQYKRNGRPPTVLFTLPDRPANMVKMLSFQSLVNSEKGIVGRPQEYRNRVKKMIVRKGLTGESPAPITRASARAAVPGIRVPLIVLSGSLTLYIEQEGIGGRRRLVVSVAGLNLFLVWLWDFWFACAFCLSFS